MITWKRRDGTVITLDGQRMTEMRTALGLTQKDVADLVGCSRASVSTWETESACPTLPQIARLRAAFGSHLVSFQALEVAQ
jgi:predicted transcriptional regulator